MDDLGLRLRVDGAALEAAGVVLRLVSRFRPWESMPIKSAWISASVVIAASFGGAPSFSKTAVVHLLIWSRQSASSQPLGLSLPVVIRLVDLWCGEA